LSFGHKDKLLEKDVAKSKISSEDAQAIKNRVTTVTNVSELAGKDIQLAMEVRLGPSPFSLHLRLAEISCLGTQYIGSIRVTTVETKDLLWTSGALRT
jgi:hypothetical protein